MSEEVDKKLYAHYKGVIAGSHSTGNAVSNELKVADAKKHMADLVKKRPNTVFEEVPEKLKSKSKEKK